MYGTFRCADYICTHLHQWPQPDWEQNIWKCVMEKGYKGEGNTVDQGPNPLWYFFGLQAPVWKKLNSVNDLWVNFWLNLMTTLYNYQYNGTAWWVMWIWIQSCFDTIKTDRCGQGRERGESSQTKNHHGIDPKEHVCMYPGTSWAIITSPWKESWGRMVLEIWTALQYLIIMDSNFIYSYEKQYLCGRLDLENLY